jgi:hypothetical protein
MLLLNIGISQGATMGRKANGSKIAEKILHPAFENDPNSQSNGGIGPDD